ncbi:acyl-homoserine-lactone synthase [Ponticaulis profundi]|uniref:Acyl-homoserine-lactone synthase n=1 Tax=Ponticaulis profundi TaxID=2665222 RepID=A0ABW1S8H7_9PROT
MIYVVTIDNQHLFARQLDQMFRMRHDYYVRDRGWTNLTASDGKETDEFDNEHAVYLMHLDRFGDIQSTFRLNPTNTPYLLADKLPEYLDGDAPRSEQIWDLTRWMIAPTSRKNGANEISIAQKELICGVMEYAVKYGITHFTTLTDTVFLERIGKMWPMTYLGQPKRYEDGDGEAVAVLIEAGPHVLAQTRDRTGVYTPVLFELEPTPPNDNHERKLREDALSEQPEEPPAHIGLVRAAADQLLESLKTTNADDVSSQIRAVEEFTTLIRHVSKTDVMEDA